MTKRYREALDHVTVGAGVERRSEPGVERRSEPGVERRSEPGVERRSEPGVERRSEPRAFQWRGQTYRVLAVLGHWREDPGWWRRPDGQPVRIEQTDLWRVEAVNGIPASRGVYELVHRDGAWTLDRVWD